MPHLPMPTLRDLAVVVVLVADAAWDGVKETLSRLRPFVEPPPDLEVRSSEGGLYTGIVLIDRNEVLAGLVIQTGRRAPPSPPARFSSPTLGPSRFTSSPRSSGWRSETLGSRFADDDDEERDGMLPGWSEDSRDEPWRR